MPPALFFGWVLIVMRVLSMVSARSGCCSVFLGGYRVVLVFSFLNVTSLKYVRFSFSFA